MAEGKHSGPSPASASGHETSDLKPRSIGVFLLVLALMLVGVLVVSVWIHNYSARRLAMTETSSSAAKSAPPPEPRLQVDAPKDMRDLLTGEDAILKSYGWVNREAGVVRIPIEQAKQLLTERGLPAPAPKGKRPAAR